MEAPQTPPATTNPKGNGKGKRNNKGKGKDEQKGRSKFRTVKRKEKRQTEVQEIESLEARIEAGKPASGSNPLAGKRENGDSGYVGAKLFEELPVSHNTKMGLRDSCFTRMTAIQRASIPHSLCGRDVLGAAKTGSGKTLAFLIPVIEKLYRLRWGGLDGVGAIIICPTRELAVQIFGVLRKVGKHHTLSAGLLIGGRKEVDEEKERVNTLNIIVCTPGRLLQHMDETPLFDCSQLQVLVLDEADRILDMGFSKEVNAIVSQLPKKRQTLLFSATQTRSVKDLARLSLKDPEYLSVHAESKMATPTRLQQSAIIVTLDQKINTLWSFIKSHLNSKILVFHSSCKQVKFMQESFKSLHPGMPVRCLHGRMNQSQRLSVMFKYSEEKHSALFATDIASRGLDFPAIDWVVQADCPEDVPSYIHRVGRTARFNAGGRSLIFIMPSEIKMLAQLHDAKIPIKVIKANTKKVQSISASLAGLLSKNAELKTMAQRAIETYLRSILLRRDKETFDVSKLPIAEYSASLGLPTVPKLRFLERSRKKQEGLSMASSESDQKGGNKDDEKEERLEANTDMRTQKSVKVKCLNADEGDDEFLTKKRAAEDLEVDAGSLGTRVSKKKKLKININKPAGQRFVFNDDGEALPPLAVFASSQVEENEEQTIEERYKQLREDMKQRDKEDKQLLKKRLQEKKTKEKQKIRKQQKEAEENDSSDESGSESDTDNENKLKKPKKVYFNDDSSSASDVEDGTTKHSSCKEKASSKSIAEQEELALKLLRSRK